MPESNANDNIECYISHVYISFGLLYAYTDFRQKKGKIHNYLLFNQVHITSGAAATLRNAGESAARLDHRYGRYFLT